MEDYAYATRTKEYDARCGRVHSPLPPARAASGFVRIRQFRLLANRVRKQKLEPVPGSTSPDEPPTNHDRRSQRLRNGRVKIRIVGPVCTFGDFIVHRTSHRSDRRQSRNPHDAIEACLSSSNSTSDQDYARGLLIIEPLKTPKNARATPFDPLLNSKTSEPHRFLTLAYSPKIAGDPVKREFNPHRFIPAQFNEFYPKRSGPADPLNPHHLPPEHPDKSYHYRKAVSCWRLNPLFRLATAENRIACAARKAGN